MSPPLICSVGQVFSLVKGRISVHILQRMAIDNAQEVRYTGDVLREYMVTVAQ